MVTIPRVAFFSVFLALSVPRCHGFNYKGDTIVINVPSQGELRGKHIHVDDSGEFFVNFFGRIPFAAAPVGDLRFRPPGPAPSWEGERDSTYYGPGCPQLGAAIYNASLGDLPIPKPTLPKPPRPPPISPDDVTEKEEILGGSHPSDNRPLLDPDTLLDRLQNISQSNLSESDFLDEDCLFMNIFAPQRTNSSQKHPVMLYIQGGGYSTGTAMYLYDGSVLAERKEVVVVTFNYRLGALGYLSTMDEVSPGNYGMLDQVVAMEWVRNNIEYFGGDKDSITLFGQSAGGASVGMHLLSPMSKGLFHKAIQHSGSPLNNWAVMVPPYDPLNGTYGLADNIGCPRQPHTELIACLRTKNAFEIGYHTPVSSNAVISSFVPVVDGEGGFLPDEPMKLLESGAFQSKVPLMMGYTKDEMALYMLPTFDDPEHGISAQEFKRELANIAYNREYYTDNVHYDDVINGLEYTYTPWEDPEDEMKLRDTYMDLLDEQFFDAGIHWQAKLSARAGLDTYMYRFDHASGIFPAWLGVGHTGDLFYTFGTPLMPDKYPFLNWTDADIQVAVTVQDLWHNFVITGNPTPSAVQHVEGSWERYGKGNERLFHIQYPISRMENGTVDFDANAYWMVYDPQLVKSASREDEEEQEVCDDCPEPEPCEDSSAGYRVLSSALFVTMVACAASLLES